MDALSRGTAPEPVPRPWTWLKQVHGTDVVIVRSPGEHAGSVADAAVTDEPGCALCVVVADCAPVALLADEAVGIAHVGWRGLLGGVVERTVEELRALGAGPSLRAVIGPSIRAGCYEFRGPERDEVAARYGPGVLAATMWSTPALDVVAGADAALRGVGVDRVDRTGGCTACDRAWFSHRARGEAGRQAGFVWLSDPRKDPAAVRE